MLLTIRNTALARLVEQAIWGSVLRNGIEGWRGYELPVLAIPFNPEDEQRRWDFSYDNYIGANYDFMEALKIIARQTTANALEEEKESLKDRYARLHGWRGLDL